MRKIKKVFTTIPTTEGAGVRLKRGFGTQAVEAFDPFLLFDDFTNTAAHNYEAGFPQHPHRGIETVTYILKGEVRHGDSLGNQGSIQAGDVQWMTAGSGILHEEMPMVHEGGVRGFQLWINMPQSRKMDAPKYQDIRHSEIPVIYEEGMTVRVLAGSFRSEVGPVQDEGVEPTYLDVSLKQNELFEYDTNGEHTFFVYVFEGRIVFRETHDRSEFWVREGEIALLTNDRLLACTAGNEGARFLVIGGKPLNESIAWAGPIVMNTQTELETAFKELQDGTFIKNK